MTNYIKAQKTAAIKNAEKENTQTEVFKKAQ